MLFCLLLLFFVFVYVVNMNLDGSLDMWFNEVDMVMFLFFI